MDKNPPLPTQPALPWQTIVLEGIARGVPLEKTLNALSLFIESEGKDLICEICVFAQNGNILLGNYGPSLPESYRAASLGLSLADAKSNPYAAVFHGGKIVSNDLATDDRWSGSSWRALILQHGLHFGQSSPIRGSDGRVLGAFTIYSPTPLQNPPDALSETAANLASIAIERHRDESALRESEQRLRLAVSGADLGTWDWNLTTNELIWSERCKEMFGYASETTLTYALFLAAIHPDDRVRTDQAVKDALDGKAAYDTEFRVLLPDGTTRWISAKGSGFSEDGTGSPLFMRGIAMDITERKEAEFLTVENSARFQFLAESLPEKIFTSDAKGETSYLNQHWAVYTGLPVEEVMRLGWREFVHPDDIEGKIACWTQAIRDGTPFEFEHRFRRADGVFRWHLSRARPMRRADGTVAIWVGSNIDVDDLKRAQFELGESESRARLAMEAAGLGFWDWDMGEKISWSPELNLMFGLPQKIHQGNYSLVVEHTHPDDRGLIGEAMQHALAERVDFETEFRTIGDNGVVRWIAAHGRAYYDELTGRPVRMIGMVREITERKHFEERLRVNQEELRSAFAAAELARKEAETANSAKDQFLAVLSHELRTPLTPVLMAASFIGRDTSLPQNIQDVMQMIQRNIKLEARLIEDLLDLTRITRNKMELQTEPMDLHLAIRQAIEICRSDFDARNHRIHVDLSAQNSRLNGDFTRLQQVFWNLLKNANKFTPEGGEIRIRSYNQESLIVVEVIDSGMGIPADVLPRIFSPFEQGDARFVREFGGLGLGLAISKAAIEAHQGTLVAHSDGQNQGATFVVNLATIAA